MKKQLQYACILLIALVATTLANASPVQLAYTLDKPFAIDGKRMDHMILVTDYVPGRVHLSTVGVIGSLQPEQGQWNATGSCFLTDPSTAQYRCTFNTEKGFFRSDVIATAKLNQAAGGFAFVRTGEVVTESLSGMKLVYKGVPL